MKAHWAYLKYVMRHKWFVYKAGRVLGVSRWSLFWHDYTKLFPDEWFPYVHTFYAPDGSKRYIESDEFSRAWNLHQKRNKHHWQHWLLTRDRGTTEPLEMSEDAVVEMVADWIGAGQAIHGRTDPRPWYEENKGKVILHKDTREAVEYLMDFYMAEVTYRKEVTNA